MEHIIEDIYFNGEDFYHEHTLEITLENEEGKFFSKLNFKLDLDQMKTLKCTGCDKTWNNQMRSFLLIVKMTNGA